MWFSLALALCAHGRISGDSLPDCQLAKNPDYTHWGSMGANA